MAMTPTPDQVTNRPTRIPLNIFQRLVNSKPSFMALAIPRMHYPHYLTREAREYDVPTKARKLLNNTSSITLDDNKDKLLALTEEIENKQQLDELINVLVEDTAKATVAMIPIYLQLISAITTFKLGGMCLGSRYASKIGMAITGAYTSEAIRDLASIPILGIEGMDAEDAEDQYQVGASRLISLTTILAEMYLGTLKDVCVKPGILHAFYRGQMNAQQDLLAEMNNLGDPYQGECQDETRWSILEGAKHLYEDSLIQTILLCGERLRKDTRSNGDSSMSQLPSLFQSTIQPTITRGFCLAKLKNK